MYDSKKSYKALHASPRTRLAEKAVWAKAENREELSQDYEN